MRHFQRLLILTVMTSGFAAAAGCAARFDGERYMEHVAYLASDELGGRAPGSPGIELAADYIAREFERAGLRPAGENGTWFQRFEVTLGQEMLRPPALTVKGTTVEAVSEKDFIPFPFSSSERFEGPLAFAGYGVSNPKENYDDYAAFDAEGKVLLMLRYEPHADDPKATFGGATPSQHATFSAKARLARSKGAKAILIVNPPLHHGEEDKLFPFDSVDYVSSYGIPMMHVSRNYANRLLAAAGADDLATLQRDLDARKNRSMDLKGLAVRGDPGLGRRKVTTRNVIALLPGNGPNADEYVVIGAHYDHLGKVAPRKPSPHAPAGPRGPEIHNGADDNASGTAGVIELARMFTRRGPTNRSLLFMAFSAEEMGLLGSDHFVDNPTVPLEKIVAMLNMDMIGRMRDQRVEVFGTDTATQFDRLVRYHAHMLGLDLKASGGGFGPSDHTSFYRKEIPALHFFTGLHSDYHMPSDDTETLNAQGAARVVQYVYNVARAIAMMEVRPTYVEVTQKDQPRTGLKVRLGVMPSYADDDEKGLLIEGASGGSPADRAGLREGDRILMIGNHEVSDVYSLMDAMNHYNPGDEANIVVLRDGKRIELGVTFEGTGK